MIAPDYNPQGTCAPGYNGILCANCDKGYSISTSKFECNVCPDYTTNAFRITAIFFACIVIVVFLIRSTLRGAADSKNVISVFQKILLNHIQLIMLTSSFDFSWPTVVKEFFKSNQILGEASDQILSIDCFLNGDSKEVSQL